MIYFCMFNIITVCHCLEKKKNTRRKQQGRGEKIDVIHIIVSHDQENQKKTVRRRLTEIQ